MEDKLDQIFDDLDVELVDSVDFNHSTIDKTRAQSDIKNEIDWMNSNLNSL